MDFRTGAGIFLPVRRRKWNLNLRFLLSDEKHPASAARVALFDTNRRDSRRLVIIPAMATTGAKLDQGGPGLLFIYLPNLIRSMPGGTLIAIIFVS